MSATFLSIIIALVATFSGLISAGIITVQLPDTPEITEQSRVVSGTISFSPETASTLLNYSILYGLLYFIAALALIVISIMYFIFCLNIRPLDPERNIRETKDIKNINNSNRVKICWIKNNIFELESLISKFNVAKTNLIGSSVILLFCTFIVANFANPSGISLVTIISLPVLVVFGYILLFVSRFIRIARSLNNTDIVRENSVFYNRIRRLDPLIASAISMYRKSSINTLLPKDGRSIFLHGISAVFLIFGFVVNFLTFLEMISI
jgi:hypothetical protein